MIFTKLAGVIKAMNTATSHRIMYVTKARAVCLLRVRTRSSINTRGNAEFSPIDRILTFGIKYIIVARMMPHR
jgi:hypothetical protein